MQSPILLNHGFEGAKYHTLLNQQVASDTLCHSGWDITTQEAQSTQYNRLHDHDNIKYDNKES